MRCGHAATLAGWGVLWGLGVLPVNADGRELLPNVLVNAEGRRPCPAEAVNPVHPLAPQSHTHVITGGLGDRRISGARASGTPPTPAWHPAPPSPQSPPATWRPPMYSTNWSPTTWPAVGSGLCR